MITYHATKLHNPDSFGMDFDSYIWRGVVIENGQPRIARLSNEDALAAYLHAKINPLYECVTTGAIAAPVGFITQKKKKKVSRGSS